MKSKTTAAKRLYSIVLVVLMAAVLLCVTGIMLPRAAKAKAEGSMWTGADGVTSSDTGLYEVSKSGVIGNRTNILDADNKTVYFQMRYSTTSWSGFYFLDGTQGLGSVSWAEGATTDTDKYLHFIMKDGDGQVFIGGNNNRLTNAGYSEGAGDFDKVTVPTLSDSLVGVEIHIGTGQDDDISYMKINDSMITRGGKSILYWMTPELFTNGCYFGFHSNQEETSYWGEFGTPIVVSESAALKTSVNMKDSAPVAEDTSFTVRNVADTQNAILKLNGTAVPEKYFSVAADNADEHALTYTVKKELWTDGEFWSTSIPRKSYFAVESTNGKAIVMLTLLNEAPPAWSGKSYAELDNAIEADVELKFTCGGAILTQNDLTVHSAYNESMLRDSDTVLTAGEDFTLSYDETEEEYTFTVKKEYLNKATTFSSVNNGIALGIAFESDTLVAKLYRKPAESGWYARSCDIRENITRDDYYTNANMAVHVRTPYGTTSRIFYNQALDVTEPIFIEFNSICDSVAQWALLQVSDSLVTMDYFTNDSMKESKLQALFFSKGNAGNEFSIQKFYGFEPSGSTNVTYGDAAKNRTLVEIYFGATKDEGYMKINGVSCGRPDSVQDDFDDKTAYIGWFFNNGNSEPAYIFRPNSHVNALAIVDPVTDGAFKMDIGAPTDFALTLKSYKTDDEIQVYDDSEEPLVAGTDYTFDSATGILTLKAAYFSRLPFAKQGTISLWNNTAGNGTRFTMEYSSSDMSDGKIVFRTSGDDADAEFTFPETAEILQVMDSDGNYLDSDYWTYENGTLILSAELIDDQTSITEFIAVAGRDLYPLYICVNDFDNGGIKLQGGGTVEQGHNVYVFDGDVKYMFARSLNLSEGVTFKMDFKSIPGYYEFDGNDVYGCVTFALFDPYSGNTLNVTVYANYDDDNADANYTALYISYTVIDEKGKELGRDERTVNITASQNPSALGVHSVVFAEKDGNLHVTLDNARDFTIDAESLGAFRFGACICSVITPASAQDANMTAGIVCFDGKMKISYEALDINNEETAEPADEPEPEEPITPVKPIEPQKPSEEEPQKPEKKGCGCGGTLGGGIAFGGGISILAACIILSRRKARAMRK